MKTCREIETLVTPYVDGEVTARDRAAIEAHLSACGACRNVAAAERTARDVIRDRASALVPTAPQDLLKRCSAAAVVGVSSTQLLTSVGSQAIRWGVRRWVPVSMVATVVLAAGGVLFFGVMHRLEAALAAQLTLDHVKCFTMSGEVADEVSPETVEAEIQSGFGWQVKVPASSSQEQLKLVGSRRCLFSDGLMAHIMYYRQGRPLSLFVLSTSAPATGVLEMMGHETIVWSKQGRTYALVGRESSAEMKRLAIYAREASE